MSELTTVTDATNASAATDNTPAVTAASIRRPGLFSALAVAGALALAGCGSDSGSDPEPAPEGDIDRAEVVEAPVGDILNPQGSDDEDDWPSVLIVCAENGDRLYITQIEPSAADYRGAGGGAIAAIENGCAKDGERPTTAEGGG